MKNCISGLLVLFLSSACLLPGQQSDWAATTSNNDEYTTIYWRVQQEIRQSYAVFDRDFENRETRSDHIKKSQAGHEVDSWFYDTNESGDTVKVHFRCEVVYDQAKIGYVINNLVFR